MEQLNDKCQLLVINQLKLKDQVALWEASKSYWESWHQNVMNVWSQIRSFSLEEDDLELTQNKDFWETFQRLICPTVEEIILDSIGCDFFINMLEQVYPKVQRLRFTLDHCEWDWDIHELVKLFPGLTTFEPDGAFSFKYIADLKNLRVLDLRRCTLVYQLDDERPGITICENMEEIYVQHFFFKLDKMYDMLNFPKLKTFCLDKVIEQENIDDILLEIAKMRAKDIYELSIRGNIFNMLRVHEKLTQFSNLRKLTLYKIVYFEIMRGKPNPHFKREVCELLSVMPTLEELQLIDIKVWDTKVEFFKSIKSCSVLTKLNLALMPLELEFIESIGASLEEILDKRAKPLTINFYENGLEKELISKNLYHSNLKLTFEAPSQDLSADMYDFFEYLIEIKLNPLT